MDRFFCALLLGALLTFSALTGCKNEAQPVFFSLLFPQLTPGYEATGYEDAMIATPQEAAPGEAVLL